MILLYYVTKYDAVRNGMREKLLHVMISYNIILHSVVSFNILSDDMI